jgi:hypothetical protein
LTISLDTSIAETMFGALSDVIENVFSCKL